MIFMIIRRCRLWIVHFRKVFFYHWSFREGWWRSSHRMACPNDVLMKQGDKWEKARPSASLEFDQRQIVMEDVRCCNSISKGIAGSVSINRQSIPASALSIKDTLLLVVIVDSLIVTRAIICSPRNWKIWLENKNFDRFSPIFDNFWP